MSKCNSCNHKDRCADSRVQINITECAGFEPIPKPTKTPNTRIKRIPQGPHDVSNKFPLVVKLQSVARERDVWKSRAQSAEAKVLRLQGELKIYDQMLLHRDSQISILGEK